jgi:hypothetical protein
MSMKISRIAAGLPAFALLTFGVPGLAAADPVPVDPNTVTDSTAYSAAAPVQNPNGQMGVSTVYTHRDGTRQITNTILVFTDPSAASAAMDGSDVSQRVVNGKIQAAAVGTKGTVVSGNSPDGTQSVSVLRFVEGNTLTTVEFASSPRDPAPVDFIVEYGQHQDAAIKGSPPPASGAPPGYGG